MNEIVLSKKVSIERCIRQIKLYYAMDSGIPFESDIRSRMQLPCTRSAPANLA